MYQCSHKQFEHLWHWQHSSMPQESTDINKLFFGDRWRPNIVGPAEVRLLHQPEPRSHKGDNGILLILAGSERFHGAAFLAAAVGSRLCDLVYFASTPENNKLIGELKREVAVFATLNRRQVWQYVDSYDAVLVGPGLEPSDENRELVHALLKDMPDTKFVIDAGGLRILAKDDLDDRLLLTPHREEFSSLFGFPPTPESARDLSRETGAVFLLKGPTDFIVGPQGVRENITGNAGMTKGGTGDVLAGMAAALATTNDIFLSACAAAFVNGLAGDRLKERVAEYYNAEDLVSEIPMTFKFCQEL